MGYVVYGLPILLEIACIVHAVRSGRVFPWIYVIIFLPLVGCIAYFAVEIVPEFLRGRTARALKSNVRQMADPDRSLREKRRDVELVGSVDAKRALAEEYVQRGAYSDAVALYRGALTGQFCDDPALLLGLARALFLSGDAEGAQANLDALKAADANALSADAQLLYARALESQGRAVDALGEYQKLVRNFPGEEARCRYAMLLDKTGEHERARNIFSEVVKSVDGAPRHYRKAQKQWHDIARAALN